MKAFRVLLNGELVTVAGAEDISGLHGMVHMSPQVKNPRGTDLYYDVGGITINSKEFKNWVSFGQLKVGDSITFEIVETNEVNEPIEIEPNIGT